MNTNKNTRKLALIPKFGQNIDNALTPENSILMLVDYQPAMLSGVKSDINKTLMNSVFAVDEAAKIFRIPAIFTSIDCLRNGNFFHSLSKLHSYSPIERKIPSFDALEDDAVMQALINRSENEKRNNVILG